MTEEALYLLVRGDETTELFVHYMIECDGSTTWVDFISIEPNMHLTPQEVNDLVDYLIFG